MAERAMTDKAVRGVSAPLLEVEALTKIFVTGRLWGGRARRVRAVEGVSFRLARGETLAVVGESGSGKSTLGRMVLGLIRPTSGEVRLEGRRIDHLPPRLFHPLRQRLQIVFQDPAGSFNPRLRLREALAEPLRNFRLARGVELEGRLAELVAQVGLSPALLDRYPHELSGGQRQRLAIARALAPRPDLIVLDEAVSALDVSVKAQIINLLVELQARLGLSYLFISHDMAVVAHIADRVAVMYLGRLVETGPTRAVFTTPRHPYTKSLLDAVPVPDPAHPRPPLALREAGAPPERGCRFASRCPRVVPLCREAEPPWQGSAANGVACHRPLA
jgi:peptide/nickel transport system ATP-binding protein